MKNIFDGLNDPQRKAVVHTDGPLLMLAGAGSGKTKALTHRIAYLVSEKKVAPSQIMAVTFTNKAAGEMRKRVLSLLERPDSNTLFPFLGTFHAICVKILRREAVSIGFPSNFSIYDDTDSQAILKDVLRKLKIDANVYTPRAVGSLISQAKNELISPHDYVSYAHGTMQQTVAAVYPIYQSELKKAGAMDFDDLIMHTVLLLRNNAEVLASYQTKFAYILVDEYQDTNSAQYELIHLLAQKHKNICVVGDDWQSIYSWRGANYRNILNFERDWPKATVVRLEQNYRSTQHILDAAGSVISKNTKRSEKKLWTAASGGQKVFIEQLSSEVIEAQFIIQTIERLTRENRDLSLNDFAILYRVNAQSRSLEESFLRHNLNYRIVGGVRFYARKEIKDTLAYLRFITQPNDSVSLNRIINLPPRGIGEKSLSRLYDFAARNELSLLAAMAAANEIEGLNTKAKAHLVKFAEFIAHATGEQKRLSISDFVEFVLKRSGYLHWLDDGSIINAERVENIKEFISVAKSYEQATVTDFLAEIALLSDIDNARFDQEAVTLMTLHAAKGLEFECIFIIGMEEGLFPHSNSLYDVEQLEEERRLCYVGMTRAKRILYLLNASSRLIYGTTQHNMPSRFLADIPSELTQTQLGLGSSNFSISHNEIASQDIPQLNEGDKVTHEVFGDGIVTFIHGEEIEIAFVQHGSKRLNLTFAPISKAP